MRVGQAKLQGRTFQAGEETETVRKDWLSMHKGKQGYYGWSRESLRKMMLGKEPRGIPWQYHLSDSYSKINSDEILLWYLDYLSFLGHWLQILLQDAS